MKIVAHCTLKSKLKSLCVCTIWVESLQKNYLRLFLNLFIPVNITAIKYACSDEIWVWEISVDAYVKNELEC